MSSSSGSGRRGGAFLLAAIAASAAISLGGEVGKDSVLRSRRVARARRAWGRGGALSHGTLVEAGIEECAGLMDRRV